MNQKLKNKKIIDITRRGKYIIFKFEGDWTLLSHLRMEGKYLVLDEGEELPLSKHNYVIFYLEDSKNKKIKVIYNDTRKFGTFHLYKNSDLETSKELSKVSYDPLDSNFHFDEFYNRLKNRSKSIKETLLNRKVISGIGNIYVSEILFKSKIKLI